jgi:AAA+ superfamily predicted ATPase
VRRRAGELVAVSLGENIVREAIAEEKARTGILCGEGGESLTGKGEVAEAFQAKIAAIGIFDDDVVGKFVGNGVGGIHDNYSPAR